MPEQCKIPNCQNDVDQMYKLDSHQEFGVVMCKECLDKARVYKCIPDSVLSGGWETMETDEPEDDNTEEVETVEPEKLTQEQKLKIAELKADYGYDTETATKVLFGDDVEVKTVECKQVEAIQEVKPIPQGYVPNLTIPDVKMYLCPLASDQEAYVFLELCKARNLNPFTNEVYLIKYNATDKAQTVVGKETFSRRAEQHPEYDGCEAGIIVKNAAGEIERREGTFYITDEETLLGGWAKVYRKDRSRPFVSEVSLHEYIQRKKDGTVNKMWSTKTATQIRKVSYVQAHREAFPSEFGGLYDRSELDINEG